MTPQATLKSMYNEQRDMLAVLIGSANILFSVISNWFNPSALNLFVGVAAGVVFTFAGTQLKGRERAQPLLLASVAMTIFFFGRFWAAPMKELFPSGVLAASNGLGVYQYGSIIFS